VQGRGSEQIVEAREDGRGVALESYTAHGLTIKRGDVILGDKELNGWAFGHAEGGPSEPGWVPKENIEE